jgi:hypothetical protein
MVVDTTIVVFGNEVHMTGDTRSDYAGSENLTIASGRLFSTGRTDILGDISGTLGPAPVEVDIRGSTYIAPSEAIVVRSDNQAQIGLPFGDPMRIGTSLRLKEANYPI